MEKLVLLQELGTMQDGGAPQPDAGEAPPSVLAGQEAEAGEATCPVAVTWAGTGTTMENLAATLLSVDLYFWAWSTS